MESPVCAPARERRVGAADGDQLLVVRAQRLVARLARPGQHVARAPTACRCGCPASRRRGAPPPRRNRSSGCPAVVSCSSAASRNSSVSPSSWKSAPGTSCEERKCESRWPGAHLLARLEVAVEGHGAAAALDPAERAALEEKSKPASISSPANQGSSDSRVAAPDLAEQEEVLAQLRAGAAAVLLPERRGRRASPCRAGSRPRPTRFAQAELRVQQVLRHLGQLGLEVGQAGDAGASRRPGRRCRAPPSAASRLVCGSVEVLRVVAGVVVDHVEQHAACRGACASSTSALQLRLGAEARIELRGSRPPSSRGSPSRGSRRR